MELRRRLNPIYIFVGLYILAFLAYIIYGLQPVDAARHYDVSGQIEIPDISLVSDVTDLSLEDGKLNTPDTIVGSFSIHKNKTLLIGHSSSVFHDLYLAKIGDEIKYDNKSYFIDKIEYKLKSDIKMSKVLAEEDEDTVVIMTCAGQMLENNDATHRLIITASI